MKYFDGTLPYRRDACNLFFVFPSVGIIHDRPETIQWKITPRTAKADIVIRIRPGPIQVQREYPIIRAIIRITAPQELSTLLFFVHMNRHDR